MLYEQMEQTGNLAESMKETKVFPEYVSSMTEIGEQTGRLDEVMDGLASSIRAGTDLMDTIKSALFYPAVMLGMLTVVILDSGGSCHAGISSGVTAAGGGLTGISSGILHMGMLLSRYSMVFVGILDSSGSWHCLAVCHGEKGRLAFRKMDGSIWISGRKAAEKIACSRQQKA